MSKAQDSDTSSAIADAIRAKRERRSTLIEDIAAIEAALLVDIENFDLDAAERSARREQDTRAGAGMVDGDLVFPTIAPGAVERAPARQAASATPSPAGPANAADPRTSLLTQLREQAEIRQRELHSALAERTAVNEAIDQALKRLFFFLHDLVQQLNIVKPTIPRPYALIEARTFAPMTWQEGFADYRTQSQAAGALVEMVSCSYHLSGSGILSVERSGAGVERFRSMLFDFGLQFNCKEFKNERRYVERAEFEIQHELSVSARWRADFAQGLIILETRNLERLGSMSYIVRPELVDEPLLDDFGRLMLGEANRFRELLRRK